MVKFHILLKKNSMKIILYKSIILLYCLICLFSCSKTIEGDLIITNVNIIDVKTGTINLNMDLIVKGEEITSIIQHENNVNYIAKKVIDGDEKYIIPGLWDMHTHTWWAYEEFFPLLIANGVTGIREMFTDLRAIKEIKTEIETGKIIGPKIYNSGPIVDGNSPTWDGSDVADSPEKGREIVRQQKASGADFIKVYFSLEKDVYLAIIDEAKKQNLRVSGHLPAKVSLEEAINAGHKSFEHFFGVLDNCSDVQGLLQIDNARDSKFDGNFFYKRLEHIISTYNPKKLNSTINLLSENKSWMCPTLTVNKGVIRNHDPNYTDNERISYMPEFALNGWNIEKDSIVSEVSKKRYALETEFYNKMIPILKLLQDKSVNFLAGTDYPNAYTYPGFSLHEELQIFVEEAGFSPLEALQTATLNPAIFMEKESEFGTVEMGKLANLVLLNKNPLVDIKNTTTIEAVILSGQYLNGNELRANIEEIARKNKLPKIWERLISVINSDGIASAISIYKKLKTEQPDAYNFDVEQLNTLGYELLETNKIKDAIKIFELNVEEFPDYANGYDSLGDGYLANNDEEKTIEVWEKAVELGSSGTKQRLENLIKEDITKKNH